MYKVFGILILVLLTILLLVVANTRNIESSLLSGFWKADESYCAEAGVELFLIHIGKASSLSNSRSGYVLIVNSEGILINEPVVFRLSGDVSVSHKLSTCRKFDLEIEWPNDKSYEFFPSKQTLTYYPECGKVILSVGDEVHGILYKDYVSADIAKVVPVDLVKKNGSDDEGADI